ncbi:MAG TPA: protein kinase, partial [Pirellulales bacterium]|nr:protein kinase [Pirellulales bacterium]
MPENSQDPQSRSQPTWALALVEGFEQAWQSGDPPDLVGFLPSEPQRRIAALAALVPIDLEYRWKLVNSLDSVAGSLDSTVPPTPASGLPARPRIEDYQREFPELGQADGQLIDMIAWEYHVRHRWGDQPSRDEYSTRFPALGPTLSEALARIDAARIDAELGGQESLPATKTANQAQGGSKADPFATIERRDGPPQPPTPLPRAFGQFQVTAKLGEGGFAVVFRGFDNELRRDVAIKVPRRERIVSAADAEAYLAEAQMLATLDHRGIVPVYHAGRSEDGLCHVVSKYVAGGDLATLLKRERPSHRRA